TIAFTFHGDGELVYKLRAPGACSNVTFSGVTSGPLCQGEVVSPARRLRCGLQTSGGISGMLVLGPIDIGSAGTLCDDQGQFAAGDYLRSGAIGEANILASYGSEIKPDFGGAAAGLGVKAAPNGALNPRRSEGYLTTWRADADGDGKINFQDADNVGALEDYV